jgi:hypothetical protein
MRSISADSSLTGSTIVNNSNIHSIIHCSTDSNLRPRGTPSVRWEPGPAISADHVPAPTFGVRLIA